MTQGEMGQGVVCWFSHHAVNCGPRIVHTENVEAHVGIVERLVGSGPNEQGKHLARNRQAGRQAGKHTGRRRQADAHNGKHSEGESEC
jgi:hypothetical protein